jgi:gliding motility-associated-like protein
MSGCVAMLWAVAALAQPAWEVSPSEFQYTMTATGIGIFSCAQTGNPGDRVAAFVDGEVRGVAHFDTEVEGEMMAYLTIYDHVPAGSEVEFQLYNASDDIVLDAVEGLVFSDGMIAGNAATPFRFRDQFDLTELSLPGDSILDFYVQGSEVSALFLINEVGDTLSGNFEFVKDAEGPDNGLFSILTSFLILEGEINFAESDTLQVHIAGTSDQGCTIDAVIQLHLINTNVPPTGLVKDTLTVPENEPVGTFVGTVEAEDETPDDVHTFSFYEAEGVNPDHAAFELIGAELYTTRKLDYEIQNRYWLDILITDLTGNSVVGGLVVNVSDVAEFDDLKAGNLVTPNSDGFNDTFRVPNLQAYSKYELLVYNAIGNQVYATRDYDNSWAGKTDKGVELPTGTYYYIFRDISNNSNRFEGEIHLYRENKF